jgi:hypothetical protein
MRATAARRKQSPLHVSRNFATRVVHVIDPRVIAQPADTFSIKVRSLLRISACVKQACL